MAGIRSAYSGGGTRSPSSSLVRPRVQAYSEYPDSRSRRAKISAALTFPAASHWTAPNTCNCAFSRCPAPPSATAAATSWAMAMNGTGIGTSTTENPREAAAARKAAVSGGTNIRSDTARHATPASSSRSRYKRWPAALRGSAIPVVMIISEPNSHGVGSSSSLTCAQATRRPVPDSPASSRSCSAGERSRSSTVIRPSRGTPPA